MNATPEILQTISSHIENGKTLKDVKEFLINNIGRGESCADLEYKNGGFRLFYTTNPNFQNGQTNGGGAGFYASLKGVGLYRTVKINI